jgi:hypothetical protein
MAAIHAAIVAGASHAAITLYSSATRVVFLQDVVSKESGGGGSFSRGHERHHAKGYDGAQPLRGAGDAHNLAGKDATS